MQALRFHYSKCLQQSWNKWRKSYQNSIQCILYQVAEKEEQHNSLLLRQILHIWRENALALIDERKATTQADEHYKRAILLKVLLQWKYIASLRVYHRQQKVAAVVEARKHLDTATAEERRTADESQTSLYFLFVLEDTAVAAAMGKAGDSESIVALVTFVAGEGKAVFSAWLRFAQGQQRNKERIEKAKGVYRAALLKEGVTRILRYTAGMKQLRGELQAQKQMKAAYNLHQSVYHCAMLWKQKALYKKVNKPGSFLPPLKKQVAFEVPEGSFEKRGCSAEERLWPSKCSDLPFLSARGNSILSELEVVRRERLPPRRPNFLIESLEGKELLGAPFSRTSKLFFTAGSVQAWMEVLSFFLYRSEMPFQSTDVNKCSSQTGNLMMDMEESSCKWLSQQGSTTHCYSYLAHSPLPSVPSRANDVHCAVQKPELRPPSSFMAQVKDRAQMKGGQPVHDQTGAHSRACQQREELKKLQPHLQSHLLSPEDLLRKWSHQNAGRSSAVAVTCSSPVCDSRVSYFPSINLTFPDKRNRINILLLFVPFIFCSAELKEREHSSREEMVLQRKLEAELQSIQQQMQYYFSRKQELRSCQQQAQILHKWLERRAQAQDQGSIRKVVEELDQLEVRISALTKAQLRERRHVQNLVARLHDIQVALDM
ncbi:hypothetical protein ASZ78_008720 [Callipepla squamata]|uniref:Protein SFI1 homolog n=1 Tax=Callipepla squamata TaxID=9009 RepID=A0A226NAN9_CALSU|nr:hypothetical protein ASZ78_008720 [Callipepla squamata]